MKGFLATITLLTYIDYPSGNIWVTVAVLATLLWIVFEGVEVDNE